MGRIRTVKLYDQVLHLSRRNSIRHLPKPRSLLFTRLLPLLLDRATTPSALRLPLSLSTNSSETRRLRLCSRLSAPSHSLQVTLLLSLQLVPSASPSPASCSPSFFLSNSQTRKQRILSIFRSSRSFRNLLAITPRFFHTFRLSHPFQCLVSFSSSSMFASLIQSSVLSCCRVSRTLGSETKRPSESD